MHQDPLTKKVKRHTPPVVGTHEKTCTQCKGQRQIRINFGKPAKDGADYMRCPGCNGDGKVFTCQGCQVTVNHAILNDNPYCIVCTGKNTINANNDAQSKGNSQGSGKGHTT